MAILNSRNSATVVSLSDLIHIVDVDDPTDNPLGTSKKASLAQIQALLGGGAATYLELTDTPSSFAGNANYFARVNSGATALEHVSASSINLSSFNNDAGFITSDTNFATYDLVFSASRSHNLNQNSFKLFNNGAAFSILETTSASAYAESQHRNSAGFIGRIISASSSFGGGGTLPLLPNSYALQAATVADRLILGAGATKSIYQCIGNLSNANTYSKLTSTGLLLGNGIGASNPTDRLTVNGTTLLQGNTRIDGSLQINNGAATTGYVWTATDALGNGSWQAAAGGAGGDGIYDGSGTVPTTTAVTLTDTLNFDSNTLYIDGTNNRVGIGTATLLDKLTVNGTTYLQGNTKIDGGITLPSATYIDFGDSIFFQKEGPNILSCVAPSNASYKVRIGGFSRFWMDNNGVSISDAGIAPTVGKALSVTGISKFNGNLEFSKLDGQGIGGNRFEFDTNTYMFYDGSGSFGWETIPNGQLKFRVQGFVKLRLSYGATGVKLNIDGLPSSATGLALYDVYTQTAAQLGGVGNTKVLCINA